MKRTCFYCNFTYNSLTFNYSLSALLPIKGPSFQPKFEISARAIIQGKALNKVGYLGLTEGIPYWKSRRTRFAIDQYKIIWYKYYIYK